MSKDTHQKTSKLDKRLEALEQQVEALTVDLKRERADFVNYKRRSELDRTQVMAVAKAEIINQLLPLFDDLERALQVIPEDLADNRWAQGVVQVNKQVHAKLGELNITRIASVGEPFDPALHEAVGFEDGAGSDEVVVEEFRPGYKLGETVLRPSMVKVGKPGNDNPQAKEENNE